MDHAGAYNWALHAPVGTYWVGKIVFVAQRSVMICNKRGLHARAAAKVVTLSERFDAEIEVEYDGQAVAAVSIMGLMMLGASAGATIALRAVGPDADEAVDSLAELIEAGFSEPE